MADSGPEAVHRSRIEWIDTDAAGIYHNSTIIRLVEAAEAQLMRDRGLDGYFPVAPRVRFEADFEAALRFGQEVTTTVRLAGIGRSSMSFAFEVWGEDADARPRRRAARGAYVTVHLPPGAERATPWPADWRTRLGEPQERTRVPDSCA